MRRIISLILCAAMLTSSALAMEPVREDKGFADAELHWSRDYVSVCWQMGLMEGVSDTWFDTEGSLTGYQCAALAARLHARITGGTLPQSTEPWYQGYVDYLAGLECPMPENMDAPCTRAEFIAMMDAVVPSRLLNPINEVNRLPDSSDEAVLRFYRAGILTGMDDYGTFRGSRTLTRAECAAMVARIADESLRLSFRPKRGDGSEAMSCLFVPADTEVMTIGGYTVTAGLYTAALTRELELLEAESQLSEYPELEKYLTSWSLGPWAVDFRRYLSESCGENRWADTDWSTADVESADARAMDWLKDHAAVRVLADKYGIELTDEELDAVEKYLEECKIEGESRLLYAAAELEDELLTVHLAEKLRPEEREIVSRIASGDWLCAEFVRFEKYELKTGERLTEAQLDFVRDGAEMFAQELSGRASHYFLEYQTRDLTCAYTAPRCTLYSREETEPRLWKILDSLRPLGVSPVLEDEEGVYVYLVANPSADESLMEELIANCGEDEAAKALDGQVKNAGVTEGDAVRELDIRDFAERVINENN
ncbi:MAG: hypothetical protein ACOX81_04365 [Candidatus Heteroscillospira sp.]|jgi:hypothetical protein